MSRIVPEFQGTSYLTSSVGGAIRWQDPERYREYEDGIPPPVTKELDIYSYGSVTLQVCMTNFGVKSLNRLAILLGSYWSSSISLHQT